ncbi:fh1 fh2 domain-containing protein 1-like isoform x2 protein [Lasius niger]|uniref:Fh1 fh2 domain-containing protein 1-like isoform x2 protein n=1 Tax=Lasius niger TaxID=67767 RepID=A0A0J7L900_LASNI|nr:fh1 fh2 domain-containing protein 1-like isoform x2 protein [Lasius niger]
MCTCDQSNPVTEEYHTAFSDFETSTPEEWRTSTRYEGDIAPEYTPTPPRRTLQRDFQRAIPRIPIRSTRRMDLTAGVAIVPRRIDFDAVSDVENFDNEEDLGGKLRRLRYDLCMLHLNVRSISLHFFRAGKRNVRTIEKRGTATLCPRIDCYSWNV